MNARRELLVRIDQSLAEIHYLLCQLADSDDGAVPYTAEQRLFWSAPPVPSERVDAEAWSAELSHVPDEFQRVTLDHWLPAPGGRHRKPGPAVTGVRP